MNIKRIPLLVSLTLLASMATFCGGRKEIKTETEANDDLEIAEPVATKASPEDLIAQGYALTQKSDCATCHHTTERMVGPSHTEVAQKYEFTQANVELLANKIIYGGSGSFGEVPMAAHAGLSKSDAEKMATYVLSLDGEKIK